MAFGSSVSPPLSLERRSLPCRRVLRAGELMAEHADMSVAPGPGSSAKEIERWLQGEPALGELVRAFPEEWATVERDLADLAGKVQEDPEAVHAYIARLRSNGVAPRTRRERQERLALQIRRHMAAAALRSAQLSAVSGVTAGRVRLNLVNGWIAQKLLFESGLRRKPVSIARFRMLWPLLWQRKLIMPLVGRKGIYCFYSGRLVRKLAGLADGRRVLEIGAGDGTLARFLEDAGVDITATDDFSWKQTVDYPENVRKRGARDALRDLRPDVVICSWPPPGNTFERQVFKTPSVDLYIVIGSRDEFAAGNWSDYRSQSEFTFEEVPELSRLVLPPELDPAVYVFRRIGRRGSSAGR